MRGAVMAVSLWVRNRFAGWIARNAEGVVVAVAPRLADTVRSARATCAAYELLPGNREECVKAWRELHGGTS